MIYTDIKKGKKMVTQYKKYDPEDLKKLQKDIVTVLKSFDALCEKYDITYFAAGGTQLGAIRHQGFIPWDDDMDLGMLYSDYEKFLKIPDDEFKEYGLYAPEKNPGDFYSFVTKYYYRDSSFSSAIVTAEGKDNMGIFVEVFPYYNVPLDNRILNKMRRKITVIKAFYTVSVCDKIIVYEKGLSGKLKYLVKSTVKLMTKIFRLTPEKLARRYDEILTAYKDNETGYVVVASDGFKIYKKSWLQNTTRVPFEDTTIPITSGYKQYMTKAYGPDYMTLPPESERWNQAAEYIRFIDGTEMRG